MALICYAAPRADGLQTRPEEEDDMKSTNKTLLALSLIGALIAGSGSASAADVVKLKFVGSHGPTTDWAWPAHQRWKNG